MSLTLGRAAELGTGLAELGLQEGRDLADILQSATGISIDDRPRKHIFNIRYHYYEPIQ